MRSHASVRTVALTTFAAWWSIAGAARAAVLPPDAQVAGRTQADYSAAWYQYVFSVPGPDNPLLDPTGAKASVNQSGPVFFLAGAFATEPQVTVHRSVTVPADKYLFFPIANAQNDNLFLDPPQSEAELRAGAAAQLQGVSLNASVDGAPVAGPFAYRQLSPVFDYAIPDDNIYDALGIPEPAQTVTGAVADGYWAMLEPLSVGQHTIRFGATFVGPPQSTIDITYDLNVVPVPEPSLMTLIAGPLMVLAFRRNPKHRRVNLIHPLPPRRCDLRGAERDRRR